MKKYNASIYLGKEFYINVQVSDDDIKAPGWLNSTWMSFHDPDGVSHTVRVDKILSVVLKPAQ